jgi:alkylhydroperoxidase family enzyme
MKLSRRVLLLFAAATGGAAQAAPGKARLSASGDCSPHLNGDGGPADLARAAARDADQTSHPPRIAPLPEDQIPEEVYAEADKLKSGVGLPSGGPRQPVRGFSAVTAKAPKLMTAHLTLANYLFRGQLPVRDREIAILRNAWLAKAPFEWGEHVKIFKRLGKGTEAEVLRIRQGSSAPGWSEHERAILRAVEELNADAMITDATWATLAKSWTEAQLIEFPILIGQYLGVAFLQNSIRVRLQEGNPGMTAK